jgi:hypothetical protein
MKETGTVTTWQDSTVNDFDGVNTGATAGTGIVNGGAVFDGSSQYIVPPLSVSQWLSTGTVEAWVKATDFVDEMTIFGVGFIYSNVNYNMIFGINTDKKLYVYSYHGDFGTPVYSFHGSTVLDTNWHHVAWTHGGTSNKLYVDGVEETLTTDGGTTAQDIFYDDIVRSIEAYMVNAIGVWPVQTYQRYFYGNMDEFRAVASVRPIEWLNFEYHNGIETNHELTFGTQEPVVGGTNSGFFKLF